MDRLARRARVGDERRQLEERRALLLAAAGLVAERVVQQLGDAAAREHLGERAVDGGAAAQLEVPPVGAAEHRPEAAVGVRRACAARRCELGVDVRRERVGGGGAQRAVDADDAVGAQRVGGGGGIGGNGGGGPAGARLGLLARRLRDEPALAARHLLHRLRRERRLRHAAVEVEEVGADGRERDEHEVARHHVVRAERRRAGEDADAAEGQAAEDLEELRRLVALVVAGRAGDRVRPERGEVCSGGGRCELRCSEIGRVGRGGEREQ